MLDFQHARLEPFRHQAEDTEMLVKQPYVFIASEMRTGKTKIVIDAAHFLFLSGVIDRVVVIAPAPVRDVWFDPEFGEIQKHKWLQVNSHVTEYHASLRKWTQGPSDLPFDHPKWHGIKWIVTNYDFIRTEERLLKLLPYVNERTLLVLDESSAVKHHNTKQTEACERLRYHHKRTVRRNVVRYVNTYVPKAGRIVLLNGTPFDTPVDLFSQGNMLHPSILDCKYISAFKARYAVMGGYEVKSKGSGKMRPTQVMEWVNIEDLQKRFAPYTIRRLQKDCLDLPPKLDAVTLTVRLSAKTWAYYKQMRDQLVVSFENGEVSQAPQAITKVMRLAQITSGFVGGVESLLDVDDALDSDAAPEISGLPDWMRSDARDPLTIRRTTPDPVKEIGREKLDALLWFYAERFKADPNFKIVVWSRFKPEMQRMVKEIAAIYPEVTVRFIAGGQKKAERLEAMKLLHPDTAPDGPVFVGGTYGTGSKGLNFTAAHTSLNCSYDYSLEKFLQSGDRVYGPGQKHPVAYYDMVAVGPQGQKTVDHLIVNARRGKADLAEMTISAWVKVLKEE